MAGIGFALRRLAQQDTLSSGLRSYTHAAFVVCGPWIFTVLALGGIELISGHILQQVELETFSVVAIYNFSFSLVVSGPIVLVVSRLMADRIYAKQVEEVPGILIGSALLLFPIQALIGVPFYVFVADLTNCERILAVTNFFLISGIWLASVFLSALKSYETISGAFALGLAAAVIGSAVVGIQYGAAGILAAFTGGLALIFYILIPRILAEFPYAVIRPFRCLAAFRTYWQFAIAGLAYNAGIWVDKWVLWLSPGAKVVAGLPTYPAYDGAMFLAYLSVLPSMALFIITIETRFHESYLRFFDDIANHGTSGDIERNHVGILRVLREGFRNVAMLQTAFSYLVILAAPALITFAKGGIEMVPIFRFGTLGALFHVILLFTIVVLSYFDLRLILVAVSIIFMVLNGSFAMLAVILGIDFYGYNYFMAAILSVITAYALAARSMGRLPYLTFVANNRGLC